MGRRVYYTLIASLPPLPRFDQAVRLPISRERLESRRRMLDPEDDALLERAVAFLAWERDPATRTDQDRAQDLRRLEEMSDHAGLWPLLEFPVNQRTIMAALRRRALGRAAPAAGEAWGAGPLVRYIVKNWGDPTFKLGALHPWVSDAKGHLEAGEALALERLLLNLLWERLARSPYACDFGLEAFLLYLLKWDIVQRWLSYNGEAAVARFEELVMEVTGEQG
jgi:hypothetical protein